MNCNSLLVSSAGVISPEGALLEEGFVKFSTTDNLDLKKVSYRLRYEKILTSIVLHSLCITKGKKFFAAYSVEEN